MDLPATLHVDAALSDGPSVDPREDRARLDAQLAKLDHLADLGLEIAEGLAAQAKGTGPKVVEGDLAHAYDRVARAVRMAVMLQSRLIEEARQARDKAARTAAPAVDDSVSPADGRKDQVSRIVRRIAQGDGRLDGYQIGWAGREARERLEHDDIYGEVMSRPVSELVAGICRDLGLNPDWKRLAEEAWAEAEMASGQVGAALRDHMKRATSPVSGSEADGGEGADATPLEIPTLEDSLQILAGDPEVLAASRRESG